MTATHVSAPSLIVKTIVASTISRELQSTKVQQGELEYGGYSHCVSLLKLSKVPVSRDGYVDVSNGRYTNTCCEYGRVLTGGYIGEALCLKSVEKA